MRKVELKNLEFEINVKSFKDEYKEKNLAFFSLLDRAVTDSSIEVYRAIEEDNDYYNLIVIHHDGIYNAFPEPLFLEYMTTEQLENKISIKEIEREEMDALIKSSREISYMYLKNREDKAKLIIKLSKLTNGKLTKEEMELLVNKTEGMKFQIAILEDAKEFASKITLKDYSDEWSSEYDKWCDVYFVDVEEVETDGSYNYIIDKGNFKFGHEEHGEHDEPDFNIDKKHAVMLIHESGNNHDSSDDKEIYELVIYIPNNNPYKVDKEIQYIIENFNI